MRKDTILDTTSEEEMGKDFCFDDRKIYPIICKFCKADSNWKKETKVSRILWILSAVLWFVPPCLFFPHWDVMLAIFSMLFVFAFTLFGFGVRYYYFAQMRVAADLAHIREAFLYTNQKSIIFAYTDRHNPNRWNATIVEIPFENIVDVTVLKEFPLIKIRGEFERTLYDNYRRYELTDKSKYKKKLPNGEVQIPACFEEVETFMDVLKDHNVWINNY